MQLLVTFLRDADSQAADKYLFVLRAFPNLRLNPLDDRVARRAAERMAKYNVRPPDAIQVGSALEEGAEAFFTNDRRLRMVREIKIEVLSDYLR